MVKDLALHQRVRRRLGALGNAVQILELNVDYNEKPTILTYGKEVNENGRRGVSPMTHTVGPRGRSGGQISWENPPNLIHF